MRCAIDHVYVSSVLLRQNNQEKIVFPSIEGSKFCLYINGYTCIYKGGKWEGI